MTVIFEELRFIIELLIAEHLFTAVFAKRKGSYWKRLLGSSVLMSVLACAYLVVMPISTGRITGLWLWLFNIGWYIGLAIGSILCLRYCYVLTRADALFMGTMGYAIQHMEYVIANELVSVSIWKEIQKHFAVYIIICIFTTIVIYRIGYKLLTPQLKKYENCIFSDERAGILLNTLILFLLLMTSFMCQAIFASGEGNHIHTNFLSAITDFFSCLLILCVQYMICKVNWLNREKEIVEHLLYERKRQYEFSKENIEMINHKCHDMKFQLQALKHADVVEKNQYIDELEQSIGIYDAVVETGNEVVNTILSEKRMNCEKREIKLSCIVDAGYLDFMGALDIYAVLGNALDNAIETVSKYKEKDKRVISLTIRAVENFLSIQTENYFDGELEFADGIPITTKKNKQYHGYGIKSMRHIAQKYGGTLVTSVKDHSFVLQIVLPMPKEFLRLYELKKEEQVVPENCK